MDRDETEPGTADNSAPTDPAEEAPAGPPASHRESLERRYPPAGHRWIRLVYSEDSSALVVREVEPPGWPGSVLAGLITQPGALGDYLEHQAPGERLARLLSAIDPADVDDFSLVELVAAHKRMEAWSAGRAARAAAVLAERDSVNPTWPGDVPGRTRGECVVGQELSMRLRVTKQAAVKMAACGRAFSGMFEPTGALLDRGLIDWPRAQAIVTTLIDLPAEVALAAQWEVLPTAPGRTLRQVRQDLEKAVIAVDPDSADDRHKVARQKRCVYRPRPLPDGMALLTAHLPAADAIATYLAVDGAARAAKNTGDSRTLGQLRADSLALMSHTALTLGQIGPGTHAHCPCGCQDNAQAAESQREAGSPPTTEELRDADAPPDSQLPSAPDPTPPGTVDASPLGIEPPGGVDAPPPDADPPGFDEEAPVGVAPPGSRKAPPSASEPPGAVSPPTLAAPDAPPPPDPSPPSSGLPPSTTLTAVQRDAEGSPPVPRVADGPPLPGHRLPGCALPTVRVGMVGGGRADIAVLVPINVLDPEPRDPNATALDRGPESVAELEGYGPIPPIIARALAAGGTWRRMVTDPTSTQVLDVGRARYQPPAAIADHVRYRDRTRIVPGCTHPAGSADLDHIHEWKDGGKTSADNLGPQCTGDHRAKTIGAFTVAYATDRTYAWTTPTGHGYLRRPDGTTIPISRRTARGLRELVKETTRSGRPVDPALVDAALAAASTGTDTAEHWMPPTGLSLETQPSPVHEQTWADEPPF